MGSPVLAMRMVGLIFLWLLALHGPHVQGAYISNSTRVTTGTLWTMADNADVIYKQVFDKLAQFAMHCCTSQNTDYGLGLDRNQCLEKQLSYWAYTKTNDPIAELNKYFDPQKKDRGPYLCKKAENEESFPMMYDSPSFAYATTVGGNPDEGHSEAKLLPVMEKRMKKETEANFFLYTDNSPCGSKYTENCQKKIFKTTNDFILPDNREHTLAVGFKQWYVAGGGTSNSQKKNSREKFCADVTKQKQEYSKVDFRDRLFFKKIVNWVPDDDKISDVKFAEEEWNKGTC